jgi:NarL family two-component system response regulator LiaR
MSDHDPIRVMIVDDHDMVRQGLAAFLLVSDDLLLVGEADSGQQAIELCTKLHPDVILMDVKMPRMDGMTATRIIRERWPNIQVVALTSFYEQKLVQEMLQAGAIGYLVKNVSAEDLGEAVRGAFAGKPILAPEAVQALIREDASADHETVPDFGLSPRELEVLTLMIEGLNNLEIAERLVISRSTAAGHIGSILSKLNASNRTEAVSIAVRYELVGHNQ